MTGDAGFSACGKWRYWLTRTWDESLPLCGFIGLNPSTANADESDHTLRRCIGFAKTWGYGRLVMLNLFAVVEKDSRKLRSKPALVGPQNDRNLRRYITKCSRIVVAWGNLASEATMSREKAALSMMKQPAWCLELTFGGFPKHPSRVRKAATLTRYIRSN